MNKLGHIVLICLFSFTLLISCVLVKGNCNTSAQLFVEEANLERGRVVIKGVGPNLVIPAISILSYGAIKLRSGVETI